QSGEGGIQKLGLAMRDMFEGKANYAQVEVGKFVEGLSGIAAVAAAGVTALAGLALGAFEAAKSLGEYGTRIKDVELRTGLTAHEVDQFAFAARAAGQDVSIFERMMKGL